MGNKSEGKGWRRNIWGYDTDTEISVVWVNISYLRKKLSQIGSGVSIKAVRNQGYTLEYKEEDRT